jgi:hypothetical protein
MKCIPPLVARQWLGKDVPVAMKETFSMQSPMSYLDKNCISYLFPPGLQFPHAALNLRDSYTSLYSDFDHCPSDTCSDGNANPEVACISYVPLEGNKCHRHYTECRSAGGPLNQADVSK